MCCWAVTQSRKRATAAVSWLLLAPRLWVQDANTRSFKLLHEYLEEAQRGARMPLPYRFHFFVRAPAAAAGAAPGSAPGGAGAQPGDSGGAPPGLREVHLTLPPPTVGAPGQAMSAATKRAFGRLLAELGLPASFGEGSQAEQDAAAAEYSRFVSLREFLPAAVEAVHQHAAAQVGGSGILVAVKSAA